MSEEAQLDRKRKCAKRKGFQDQNNDGKVICMLQEDVFEYIPRNKF